jgi:hypothetical protein
VQPSGEKPESPESEDEASCIGKPEECDYVNRIRITDRIKDATDEIRAKIACAAIEVRPAKGIANVDQYRR